MCPHCVWKIHRKGITQSIRNFWRSGWSVGTKLTGCWRLKDKNSSSKLNNHLLFDVHIAYRSTRMREEIRKDLWIDTKRNPHPTELHRLSDVILLSYCVILLESPNICCVLISQIKPVTRHEYILFTFGLPGLVVGVLAWTFQFDLRFGSMISADWKTRGLTKPNIQLSNNQLSR